MAWLAVQAFVFRQKNLKKNYLPTSANYVIVSKDLNIKLF